MVQVSLAALPGCVSSLRMTISLSLITS